MRRTTATSRQSNRPRRAPTISPARCSGALVWAPFGARWIAPSEAGEGLVIAYVDVDGLKAVNDSVGHTAGDAPLTSVADSISHDLRSYDVICRFGGDEFLCSLAGQDTDGARERFQQIGRRLSSATSGATITVGFAERTKDDTVAELVARADAAPIETRQRAEA